MNSAVAVICDHGARRQGGLVCVANVDMLTRAKRTPRLAELMHKAVAVVTDGMPLVWALRKLHGRRDAARVYGPGLVLAVCAAAAARGQSVFLFGGTPDELSLMQQALLQRFPALQIAGALSPPLLPAEPPFDATTVDLINASGASVVFVGLGCPKQEFWMDTHQRQLEPVSIGVGLAFALIAGTKSQAPRWMRDHGLEWLYRLCQEPGRLWKRYLVGNTLFIGYALKDWLHLGKR
ncbi:WecB/TagA/CpsF family glycosyltransferase [Roseateles sp.]|uniref:WecB/TagA/CpsF family glycosyltransferase n=1 Tax=Roseateles sp. TaxID=1971397 RepID=UPI003BAB6569